MVLLSSFTWLVITFSQITEAKPVAIPLPMAEGLNIGTDTWILISMNLLTLLILLAKAFWDGKEKRADKTVEKVDKLTEVVSEIRGQIQGLLNIERPDEAAIINSLRPQLELYIYRVIRDVEREEISRKKDRQ